MLVLRCAPHCYRFVTRFRTVLVLTYATGCLFGTGCLTARACRLVELHIAVCTSMIVLAVRYTPRRYRLMARFCTVFILAYATGCLFGTGCLTARACRLVELHIAVCTSMIMLAVRCAPTALGAMCRLDGQVGNRLTVRIHFFITIRTRIMSHRSVGGTSCADLLYPLLRCMSTIGFFVASRQCKHTHQGNQTKNDCKNFRFHHVPPKKFFILIYANMLFHYKPIYKHCQEAPFFFTNLPLKLYNLSDIIKIKNAYFVTFPCKKIGKASQRHFSEVLIKFILLATTPRSTHPNRVPQSYNPPSRILLRLW